MCDLNDDNDPSWSNSDDTEDDDNKYCDWCVHCISQIMMHHCEGFGF